MVTIVMHKAFGWLLMLLSAEKAGQDIHMDVASIRYHWKIENSSLLSRSTNNYLFIEDDPHGFFSIYPHGHRVGLTSQNDF
jgi:hypothetical protein